MKCIDLFAGAGGFTEGATQAGCTVLWAGNHWPLAVDVHQQNHPFMIHLCQDLHQADWTKVPDHDLLLASPSCQGHSAARGKEQPRHDAARATAWAVVSACEVKRPQTFLVENVKEFLTWSLYPAWELALKTLGYHITTGIYDAANFGVPQNRVRVFVCGNLGNELNLSEPSENLVPASSFIDFGTGSWSPIHKPGRSLQTLKSIRSGRTRCGLQFLTPFYSAGSGLTGRSLDRPIGTITTKARWLLVDGERCRMLTVREIQSAMVFPPSYKLPSRIDQAIHLLGNAVPPPMPKHLIQQIQVQL